MLKILKSRLFEQKIEYKIMIMKKLLIVILPIVCNSAFTTDTNTSYNMNRIWDDFDEAYGMLTEKGFRNFYGEKIIETKSARSAIMISPSGFAINLIQHIKKQALL